MRTSRVVAICCGLTMATFLLSNHVAGEEQSSQESRLIEVLKSDAPKREKAITCKHLALHGTAASVPMLAELLADEELASWALIALEAIPDPAADDALREALADLDGRVLVGVINSIGVRRDAQAVEPLVKHLGHANPHVVAAAAYSLGKIGTSPAASALAGALDSAPDHTRSSIAEGCVLCAERLLVEGQANDSTQLYEKVRSADVSKQRVLEATRGSILSRKADGLPLLVEQLRSDDAELFAMALRTSREISGPDVTKAIVSELPKHSPQRQVMLITALADRDDGVLPAILQAAKSGPSEVRAVAISMLRRVGDASCVPVLLKTAVGNESQLAATAKEALKDLPGSDVDADIAERLSSARGDLRRVLIELVGMRRIDAVPALLKAADDPDTSIRAAALASLGETVGQADLGFLIARVATPKKSSDTEAALKALHAACVRMPDRDACAEQLFAALGKAPASSKVALLETIGSVGGTRALESVASAAAGNDARLKDTASQLLGKWMTTDAAPVLLSLANSASEDKYKIRALRGYIRMARQFSFPIDDRVEMCRQAMKTAHRNQERTLVLEVLERYPSVGSLQVAADAASVPSMKDRANSATLVIARKLGGDSVDVKRILDEVGQSPKEVEIVKATYGANETSRDVTAVIRKHAGRFPIIILPSASYNASLGGDPVPGVVKRLHIKYKIDGKSGEVSLTENDPIVLPIP